MSKMIFGNAKPIHIIFARLLIPLSCWVIVLLIVFQPTPAWAAWPTMSQLANSLAAAQAPEPISARSYLILDVKTGRILASRAPQYRQNPASITKLMTALIIAENQRDLQSVVEVPAAAAETEPSKMNLFAGEQITAYDLMQGALISSANDAALALAYWAGGGSIDQFVPLMNQKAKALGMDNTRFRNPVGFDYSDHYSTAYDVALMSYYAMRNPVIRAIVDQEKVIVHNTDSTQWHTLRTTNELLGRDDIKGLKTGRTDESGESLVLYAERGEMPIIVVVLGSEDRFGDGEKLVDWAYAQYAHRPVRVNYASLEWSRLLFGDARIITRIAEQQVLVPVWFESVRQFNLFAM